MLALISGLTLPPLAIAALWLLALSLARLLARSTRRSPVQSLLGPTAAEHDEGNRADRSSPAAGPLEQSPAPSASSRKIAA